MTSPLSPFRPLISEYLSVYLDSQKKTLPQLEWSHDAVDRLKSFALTGKLLRGSLLLAMYQMLGGKETSVIVPAAASLELMQSSLLIHDDIIDRDLLRRGKPSILKQYQTVASEKNHSDSEHMGMSLALCLGDIGFFWGFELLNRVELTPGLKSKLIAFFAQEYATVGIGQMVDVHQTAQPELVTEAEIINLYTLKTARYTFCLPMLMGAQLAVASTETMAIIDKLGLALGLLFQLKDDELGLFGTEAETGKPITSDVREGKKTLYYLYLLELLAPADKSNFESLFGKSDLSTDELWQVQDKVKSSGAKDRADQMMSRYELEVKELIHQLPISLESQQLLVQFVDYSILRRA